MNEKEVAELRRRYKPDKNNISKILGCYVNEKREVISAFSQTPSLMPPEETERYLSVLKKTLSGGLNKNLIDIRFSTKQVMEGEEHKLLSTLKSTALKDEETAKILFNRIIENLSMEGQYLILLAYDTYDVPFRGKDGEDSGRDSQDMFSYILCSVCPVKQSKPALSYSTRDNEFRSRAADWVVAAPELGFLFPAFDDRASNIYNALYYSKDTAHIHDEFVQAVFNVEPLTPPAAIKETFDSVLCETLEEDCNLEVLQGIRGELREKEEMHKANKEEEPLTVTKREVQQILKAYGVSQAHVESFSDHFDNAFGEDATLTPGNIVDVKKLALRTPEVVIQVNSARTDLVETRIINGTKYVLINADEGVEVNGVMVQIHPDN